MRNRKRAGESQRTLEVETDNEVSAEEAHVGFGAGGVAVARTPPGLPDDAEANEGLDGAASGPLPLDAEFGFEEGKDIVGRW